jgi:replication factor A1
MMKNETQRIEIDVEKVIRAIVEKTGLSQKEVKQKIQEKIEQLGGLLSAEGAAVVIAREYGVDITFKSDAERKTGMLKLSELIEDMQSACVAVRVLRKYPPREYSRSDGTTGKVASILVADDTDRIRAVFWDSAVNLLEKIKEGDALLILDAYTKRSEADDSVELHIGRRGRVVVNPSDVSVPELVPERKRIEELSRYDMNVEVICKVVRVYEPREFLRSDGSRGLVLDVLVADETGTAKLVLWDEDTYIELSQGDTLLISNAYIRETDYGLEIHLSRSGTVVVEPEGESCEVNVEEVLARLGGVAQRKFIAEIQEGELVEIRGCMVDLKEPRSYETQERQGVVVNATIDDGTGNVRVAFYDRLAEALLGAPADELIDMDGEEFKEVRRFILGRELVVTGRVRKNEFLRELEISAREFRDADPAEELRILAERLKPHVPA